MYLKSLTLRGFKSFASSTVFDFDQRINAVVGPNGSGKSNIVDALSWVMGEQGAKSLRGGSMQDLIFAGTSQRPALGRAKVTLVFDNSDGAVGIPLSEISMSRTMFRSGGSEYELNGQSVRLADLQDLLADAGLGKSQHILVGQGQIDRVLQATALERRGIIEEAAGVLKHRRRAEKTERKLEAMKANLDRLEDLEAELAKQLEPLGEQAQSAQNAREIQAQIGQSRAELLAADASELLAEQKNQDQRSLNLRQDKTEAQKNLANLQKSQKKLEEQVAGSERELKTTRLELAKLEKIAATVAAHLAVARERARTEDNWNQEEANQRLGNAHSSLASEKAELERWASKEAELEESLAKKNKEIEELSLSLRKQEEAQETASQQRVSYRDKVAELTANLAAARAGFERIQQEAQSRQQELETAKKEIAGAGEKLTDASTALAGKKAELADLEESEKETRLSRQRLVTDCQKAEEEIGKAKLALEALLARKQTLQEALGENPSIPKNALILHSALTVESGWEKAISRALADYADAVVLEKPTDSTYSQIYTQARDKQVEKQTAKRKLPDFARPASQVIEASAPLLAILQQVLENVVLISDEVTEKQLATLFASYPELCLITAKGLIHRSFAKVYPSSTRGTIETSAQLAQTEKKIIGAEETLASLKETGDRAAEGLRGIREAEKTLAKAVGKARAEEASLQAQLASLRSRNESAEAEIKRLVKRAETAQEAEKKATALLQETEEALDALIANKPASKPVTFNQQIEQARAALTQAQQEQAGLSAQKQNAEEQKETYTARLMQAEEAYTALKASLQVNEEARLSRLQQKQTAQQLARQAQTLAQVLETESSQTNKRISDLEERSQQLRDQHEALSDEMSTARTLSEKILEELGQASINRARLETRYEALTEKILEETGKDLEELAEGFNPENFDRQETENKLIESQKKLANIGTVNPLALEEFSALQERHQYLTAQISDLKKSRADMRSLIRDLNLHIKDSFSQAFEEIRVHFEDIFAQFFPGGEGTLVLTDPKDLLNTGIDIQARPAGKKIKRLSLLSGGERSLASLALLTAIFSARPAPFYLLDEVEAALDDANLSRVLTVLNKLAEKSQLIIITHKPRTVEIADTLYGISMREGVSLAVSQTTQEIRQVL